ncbi:MAG: hypothetical protein ACP5JG_18450 [Anaerolineae bacterium]
MGTRLALANTLSGVVLFDVQDATKLSIVGAHPGEFWSFFSKHLR